MSERLHIHDGHPHTPLPFLRGGLGDELVSGGGAAGEEAIYLALSLRNVGSGLAVLHGWHFYPSLLVQNDEHPQPDDFRRLTRDIYIAPGDVGFWQGALRDRDDQDYPAGERAIADLQPITVDPLYGDQEGGQRVITRCVVRPHESSVWLPAISRHWNVDRQDPR